MRCSSSAQFQRGIGEVKKLPELQSDICRALPVRLAFVNACIILVWFFLHVVATLVTLDTTHGERARPVTGFRTRFSGQRLLTSGLNSALNTGRRSTIWTATTPSMRSRFSQHIQLTFTERARKCMTQSMASERALVTVLCLKVECCSGGSIAGAVSAGPHLLQVKGAWTATTR